MRRIGLAAVTIATLAIAGPVVPGVGVAGGIEIRIMAGDDVNIERKSSAAFGESFRGGVCAEVAGCDDSGGDLVVASRDDSGGAYYGTDGYVTGATSTTDGYANTDKVATAAKNGQGSRNPPSWTPNGPIQCWNKSVNGFEDWYMPAKDELKHLYDNLKGVIAFNSDHYWSSTETSAGYAYRIDFRDGDIQNWEKFGTHSVRCVRRVDS